MQKLRKKKRMAGLAVAFMLVFLVGAAFAFDPGILDIVGTINLTSPPEAAVVWEEVDTGDDLFVPFFAGSWRADSEAEIVNARGRDKQRIEWEVTFTIPLGFDGNPILPDPIDPDIGLSDAVLVATARNASLSDNFIITGASVTWYQTGTIPGDPEYPRPSPAAPADFGLTVTVDETAFIGTLTPGQVSGDLTVTVVWDGTMPSGLFSGVGAGDPEFAATLVIEFDYDLAP